MRITRGGRWLALLTLLGFLQSAGCSNNPTTQARHSPSAPDTKTSTAPPTVATQPAADTVAVKVVKYEGMQDAIKQLKGKVVVVDVWADW